MVGCVSILSDGGSPSLTRNRSATLPTMKGKITRCVSNVAATGFAAVSAYALSAVLFAQILPSFPSTKINPDHSITFRYRDPGATAVLCSVENVAKPLPMHKDAEGIWTITSGPLPAGIYRYHFEINGISFLDPANPVISNSLMRPANMVTVPGDGPQLWDATAVPHGAVHHHTYTTSVVLGLRFH
jgi:1,4-alpha-glucan branching enzyme